MSRRSHDQDMGVYFGEVRREKEAKERKEFGKKKELVELRAELDLKNRLLVKHNGRLPMWYQLNTHKPMPRGNLRIDGDWD